MRKFCRHVRLCLSLLKNCAKLKLAYFFVCYCVKTPRNRIHKNPIRQKQDCILLTFFLFDSKKKFFLSFFLGDKISRIAQFFVQFFLSRFLQEEVWSPNKRCHKLRTTFYVLLTFTFSLSFLLLPALSLFLSRYLYHKSKNE